MLPQEAPFVILGRRRTFLFSVYSAQIQFIYNSITQPGQQRLDQLCVFARSQLNCMCSFNLDTTLDIYTCKWLLTPPSDLEDNRMFNL